jgi:hypothetical protein
MLSNGDGSFQAPAGVGGGGKARSMAVGDLNSDGKMDLAYTWDIDPDYPGDVYIDYGLCSVFLGNGDGSFGVDVNRNYGYNWGYDDEGSSPEGWMETYRGPAAWSEPEVAALRDFAEARRITAAIHFHSHGELYLYSWGYADGAYTPDDALFFSTSAEMASANGYTYGASPDVLYRTNGGANDWFYGEQATKPKAFRMPWVRAMVGMSIIKSFIGRL